MAISLYMDVPLKRQIILGLRRRGVDVLTAIEDGRRTLQDDELLERARTLGRLLVTHDIGFRVMAEDWQRQGRPFAGLAFAPEQGVSIGRLVADLELIAKASDPAYWLNRVERLPY